MKCRLLFLGPPGAGKGTQAERICKEFGLMHLSTGDLLRAEVSARTPLGEQVSLVMNRGELVSDELVLAIVDKSLSNHLGGWVLDGFPRNVNQAKALEALLRKINQPLEAVVLLEVADHLLIERLLSRGRQDDNEEVIRHRLRVYEEQTTPLIDHYSQQGLINTVDADGSIESIKAKIEKVLN